MADDTPPPPSSNDSKFFQAVNGSLSSFGNDTFTTATSIPRPKEYLVLRIWIWLYSGFHGVVLLSCLSALVLLLIRTKRKQHKSILQWMGIKIYMADHTEDTTEWAPLFLPNSGLLLTVAQLMHSLLAEVFVVIRVISLRPSSFRLTEYFVVLATCIRILQFYASWILTWTLIFSRLFIDKTYSERFTASQFKFLRPAHLNAFFIVLPIIVTAIALAFVLASFFTVQAEMSQFLMQVQLNNRPDSLKYDHHFPPDKGFTAIPFSNFILIVKCSCAFWGIVSMLNMAIFVAASYKLKLSSLRLANPLQEMPSLGPFSGGLEDSICRLDPANKSLENVLANLVVRCVLVIAALVIMFSTSLVVIIMPTQDFIDDRWMDASIWLVALSDVLSSLGSSYGCWRIHLDYIPALNLSLSREATARSSCDQASMIHNLKTLKKRFQLSKGFFDLLENYSATSTWCEHPKRNKECDS